MRIYKMEDGVNTESNKVIKMGATGNPNITRLATLQERRKTIEETLAKCNQELKQICLQEADLTGIVPIEMPLEPGESPPMIRRRVGTSYQLPENLIKNSNNKDESVTDLELQIQVHANLAEAALGLANEQHSKTLRRKHMSEYQHHKIQYTALQEKLSTLKDKAQQVQQQQQNEQFHKQKKKPRPAEQDDSISVGTNMNEPFTKSDLRHSVRSNQNKRTVKDTDIEQRYVLSNSRMAYKSVSNSYVEGSYLRHEEKLARGFYALSLNGYKNYLERQENLESNHGSGYNTLQYNQHNSYYPMKIHYPHSQAQNQCYQHASRPNTLYNYPVINQNYNQVHNSPTNQVTNSRIQHRQTSPNMSTTKMFYSSSLDSHSCRLHVESEQNFHTANPHQIQPHQQYEHMTSGLGGYWKRLESGQMVWCNSSPTESNWQRDKRFGSLDRRKNKRLHKRLSPSVGNKSATLASVPVYTDQVRRPQVINNRRSLDNRQLVRTQSLGSVGGQTVDSVWPSDDNSSCESDNRSVNEAGQNVRKQKQKDWMETFLDGPVSPTHSVISRSQSALPSVLSPEEKYIVSATQAQHAPPPPTPKPPLEIPAESNPSPRTPETNIELFNNNIPKNCTIVQAGHCKPYHEETKPFEMSDYYKYSTKFKKSPVKQQQNNETLRKPPGAPFQKNLNESFDKTNLQSVKNHNFSPGSPQNLTHLDNSNSLNSSLDLGQLSNANVAERFSDEMNAWYTSHKLQIENSGNGNTSKGKSNATLV